MPRSPRSSTVSRQRRRSSCTTSRTGWIALRLAPVNAAVALLEERRDALGEVGRVCTSSACVRASRLELLLERRRLGVVEQALRLPDGPRRHRREELGDLGARVGELVGRNDLGDESPLERLCGGQSRPVASHSNARAAPSRRRASQVAPVSGTSPMPTNAGHEARRVGGDAHVAREREREAGAGRGAVDDGDHGLLERADREHVPVAAARGAARRRRRAARGTRAGPGRRRSRARRR